MTSMDNTPDSPAKTPEGYTTQGGNFWTLITPETWKVLHAVLHPESHRFQIPEDCHWNDVRSVPTNVGAALQHAMREIEKVNPDTLYGVFGDAQWTNKDRLSDALLKDLIEHFSRISFGNKNITSDVLGDAYEYLIESPR